MKMDIYETITNQIIAAIEAGAGKWQMPWHTSDGRLDFGLPHNVTTGKNYNGVNTLVLWMQRVGHEYKTDGWATFKQWAAIGAKVKKGEKGTACIKWSPYEKKFVNDQGQDDKKNILVPSGFIVFNADQVDGWDGKLSDKIVKPAEDKVMRHAIADAMIVKTGAIIRHGGNSACFIPSIDTIMLPPVSSFLDTKTARVTENYYATVFHELGHWTKMPNRLNRDLGKKNWGDSGYAMEELVAELTAAFLCCKTGITNEPRADHAQYLSHWLNVLKADKKAIVTAASLAQKAADFIENGGKK